MTMRGKTAGGGKTLRHGIENADRTPRSSCILRAADLSACGGSRSKRRCIKTEKAEALSDLPCTDRETRSLSRLLF